MLIIVRTPVRISFFGGGTDYPVFFREYNGAVLGTTIDQYIYTSIKTLKRSFFDHKIRIAYSKTELVKNVLEIEHPSIREVLKYKSFEGNLDIHIFSDLPAKTGLGSSSAFTVGFCNALDALLGKKSTKQGLAKEACLIEQTKIKENVGSQDQFHAAYGGLNLIEFKKSDIKVKPIEITPTKKKFLQDHLMIFFTGVTRNAHEILQEQIEKTKQNVAHLKKMLELVFLAKNALLTLEGEELLETFGTLLHSNWELKKNLSSQISNPVIDEIYEKGMRAGAYGGKLCGAGSGGFFLFIVPQKKQMGVREALKNIQEVRFNFENEGSTLIYRKE